MLQLRRCTRTRSLTPSSGLSNRARPTSSGPERLQKQPDCRNQYDGGDYQADYRINDVQAGP